MYASNNNAIDYEVVTKSTLIKTIEPVKTFAGQPPAQYQQQATGFASQFNAVDSMVCKSRVQDLSRLRLEDRQNDPLTPIPDAYSGALLFVAFLGEMRNPWVSPAASIALSNVGADRSTPGLLERHLLGTNLHLLRLPAFWRLRVFELWTVQRFEHRQCKPSSTNALISRKKQKKSS